MDLPDRVLEESDRLRKELEGAVATIREPQLREAAMHYPRAGGKAIRPALAVLACEAAGGKARQADPLALSVELLHTFSLVHDDLMDHDEVRRGVPAVHRAFDEATAILAGDALYALSFEQLARLDDHPSLPRLFGDVAATARTLCEGQSMDMAFEAEWPTLERYEEMIARKTAALFSCATRGGALVAGAGEPVAQAFSRFGRDLGLAFQIQDDVLDLTVDTQALGKPRGSDVLAGKKTHPLIRARETAAPEERERLSQVLEHGAEPEDVDWVLDLCERTGSLEESRARAHELFQAAEAALDEVPDGPARQDLGGVLAWVRQRGH